MKQMIKFVDIRTLIQHEQIDRARLDEVRNQLRIQGVVRRPVIVDEESNVILDGHHRVQVLRELGAKHVPVVYVRYSDETVRVYLRRKDILMKLLKRYVVEKAISHELFPSKTTRHLIRGRPGMKAVRIEELMYW